MTSLSGYETVVERTLDGLTTISADSIDVTNLVVNGTTVNLADLFNKTTDDTDDILVGVANLFLTPGERADIALNTAQRHAPVTLGTANGLALGGVEGQELSLAAASATATGALTAADWAAFDGKQDAITGAASTVTTANLTASRALVSDGAGKVSASSVTSTELGYLAGATSNIQAQLNAVGGSPWQEVVTPGGSFIRTYTTPATVEVNDRLNVSGYAKFASASSFVEIGQDPNAKIELKGGAPYIDFSTDTTSDYMGRIQMASSTTLKIEAPATTITGSATVGNGLTVTMPAAASVTGIQNTCPLSAGQRLQTYIGKDLGTLNGFYNWYQHAGDGSTNNSLRWDVNGYDNIIYMRADGKLGIGTNNVDANIAIVYPTPSYTTATYANHFGVRINDAGRGSGIIYATDLNHSIWLRGSRATGPADVTSYYQYGSHRFYAGGMIENQTHCATINTGGVRAEAGYLASRSFRYARKYSYPPVSGFAHAWQDLLYDEMYGAISYVNSGSSTGDYFVVNQSGIFSISASMLNSISSATLWIDKNTAANTGFGGVSAGNMLAVISKGTNWECGITYTGPLAYGDVVRVKIAGVDAGRVWAIGQITISMIRAY